MAQTKHTIPGLDRAQQDAMHRLREVQGRTRTPSAPTWSTNPSFQRRSHAAYQPPPPTPEPPPEPIPAPPDTPPPEPTTEPPPAQEQAPPTGSDNSIRQPRSGGSSSGRRPPRPEPPPSGDPGTPKDTTVLQDILGGVGLDDDRILILGLILILINDKADTTVILALLYLLL